MRKPSEFEQRVIDSFARLMREIAEGSLSTCYREYGDYYTFYMPPRYVPQARKADGNA